MFLTGVSLAHAQQDANTSCQPPQIIFNKTARNIFSEQQEMDLGDAMAERFQKSYRVIDDAEINAYLQNIGDRLIKHLPPTNLKFRFVVVDLPMVNAFAAAGGRIYVTRKMISFARNEDELAGVMAHELGHGIVRHSAIDTSKLFKEILNVTQVGDRRDVFDKYNQYIEKRRTKYVRMNAGHEDDQQLEADRIGMFAMIAAGYDPNIYTDFWSRFTDAKKTGVFADLFGMTKPVDKRLREMIAAMKSLPAQCLEKRPAQSKEDFEKWKARVINFSGFGGKEALNGLIYRRRLDPLRSDIEHLRFSPNGEYVLAQDSSGISVLSRQPLAVLFRIDTDNALPANFTPDSKTIVVYNKNLRVQKWSIEEKNAVSTHEVFNRRGYWQSEISPDGNFLACYEYNGDLTVYNVATNEPIFTEKRFYVPGYFEYLIWRWTLDARDENEIPVFNMKFSPDNRYFLAGRKTFLGKETIGIDLQTRKTIQLGENVKKLLLTTFTFAAPDKIVGQLGKEIEKSGVFKFPTGERIEQFELNGISFTKAERGDYLMVRPVVCGAVGVYDLKAKKYALAYRKSAFDVFDDYFVAELKSGELALHKLGKKEPEAILSLPPNRFGNLRTVAVSPDGNWLAASEKWRGAVWNLQTGERPLHVRGFRGSFFALDGMIYADFPKFEKTERTLAAMDAKTGNITAVGNAIGEKSARQYEQFMVSLKSLKPEKEEEKKEKDALPQDEEYENAASGNVLMEVSDAQTGALLWSRQFTDERPRYAVHPRENAMALVWSLKSKAAKSIVKSDAALSVRASAMGEKEGDYFIQIVEPKTGKITGQVLLETGEGSFEIEDVQVAGDWLVVRDDTNRVLLYSISEGAVRQRFFGGNAALTASGNLIAIENFPGNVTIYDSINGAERGRLTFKNPISAMIFLAEGKRLFVLTGDQTAFMFDAAKFGSLTANSTK